MRENSRPPSLLSPFKRVLKTWEVIQVELHGKYPLERIKALNAYSHTSSLVRVLLVCLLTPLPCIILVTLEDFIPLNDPKLGIFDNYVFWLRDCIAVAFVTIAVLEQFRHCLPRLPLSNAAIVAVTLVATAAGVGSQFSFACWIGFPLPFAALFGELTWTPAVVVSCTFLWGKQLLRDRTLVGEMLEYVMVLMCQVVLTLVYPAYIFVFTRLTGWSQTAFVLTLPVIKILAKNWIAHYLNDLDHLKPEAVIFNVDVFSALYVSCSLMTRSSTSTTVVVMTVDLVQIFISIADMNRLNTELQSILSRVYDDPETCANQSMIDVCAELLTDARVHDSLHFKQARRETRVYKLSQVVSSKPLSIISSHPFAANQARVAPTPSKTTAPTDSAVRDVRSEDSQSRLETKAIADRVLFVDTAARMFFLTEFVLLVEFTEVMMPVIYTTYLVVMSHVPNRQYYPRLAAVNDDDLAETVASVLTLAVLELVSLIGFATVIYRKLRISPLHQVAFVLDKQFASVQSKLILWMFYVVQTMLVHFASLLERRQSYDRIPRFFFPKVEADDGIATHTRELCRQRALEQIDELLLSQAELKRLTDAICQHAYAPKLTTFQKSVLKKAAKVSNITVIYRMLRDNMVLLLSYDDWKSIRKTSRSSKVEAMMTAQAFLMLPQDEDNKVNGYALLEYVYELHRKLSATRFLLEQPDGAVDGRLSEGELSSILERLTVSACKTTTQIKVEEDFCSYYELICTRKVVLHHDFKTGGQSYITIDDLAACPVFLEWFQLMDAHLHDLFVVETNWFHPDQVRNIHRQYLQLDRDKNGLISVDELMDYGKKRAFNPVELTPTHDLTRAFVVQVFHETKTFPPNGEMDYKAYIDFTLMMTDRSSLTSLRFFWNVLDFNKQGFLDAFTIDFFLRELVVKINEHQNGDVTPNEAMSEAVSRLRTQVFDLVAPREPLRITWRDLTTCKLGYLVVRMLIDYAAYHDYEACEGRFTLGSS